MARKEKVTKIIDGDTFTTGSRKRPVRLANVHAPEKGIRGAWAATQALKDLVQGQTVSIETVARDKYGRSVARVTVGNRSNSGDTILNYLFPLFFHGPFGPVFFFRSCFPNNTSSLSRSKSLPRGLPVRSC